MPVRAIVFDIGGVLERTAGPERWFAKWQDTLGLTPSEFGLLADRIDPEHLAGIGRMSAAEYRLRWKDVLGLSDRQADEFIQDMWDWYCGELDEELTAYAADLGTRHRTAILSNSGVGAREEEERRYGFAKIFDPIVYSHEVGLLKPDPRIYELTCTLLDLAPEEVVLLDNWQVAIDGATEFGMHGVLHVDTPGSIRAINALL